MPSPSTAITRLDLSLTYQEFSLAANQQKYIGLQVLPPISVQLEGADFVRIAIDSLLTKIEDTRRAPKAGYARDDWEWTKDSYAVEEHGVEEIVDDATVEKYGDVLRTEQIATARAVNRVLQRLEYDIAAAVFNTTTWTGAALTTTVGTAWTTAATADPIGDIDAAHDKVNLNCGEDANTLVLTKKGFRSMVRTARLEGLLKYDASELMVALSTGQNQSMVSEIVSGLKDLLQVEQILVGRGFKNTADKGQPASLSRVWDDTKAMLCVVRNDGLDGDLENPMPQIGRTIFSTKNDEPLPGANDAGLGSLIIEEYRENPVRGGVIRPRNKRMVKILHPQAGHLLQGVTAQVASQIDELLEVYAAAQLEQGFGVPMVLCRGGLESASFTATWERVEYEISDQEGFLTKRTSRDFVFPTTATVLAGQLVEPRAGDRLRLSEAGTTIEYELLPLGKLPAAESMPGGYRWKVHTKKVET